MKKDEDIKQEKQEKQQKQKQEKQTKQKKSEEVAIGVFINPRSDFGFKKIFTNPAMMISFLNAVISPQVQKEKEGFSIRSIDYLTLEYLGATENERRIIVDSRCRTDTGEDIIVEMQNARPMNFFNRLTYYLSYLIQNQIPQRKHKGEISEEMKDWNYEMNAIYIVAIVNFPMNKAKVIKGKKSEEVVIDWTRFVSIVTKETSSEMVNFIIVDLTKFNKKSKDLKTIEDYWLYTMKHADTLQERPAEITDELFMDLYDNVLQINKLTPKEMKAYNSSVLDIKNHGLFTEYTRIEALDEGRIEGRKEGRKEGMELGVKKEKEKTVVSGFKKNLSIEVISSITDLSKDEIISILRRHKLMS